jgi:signal peptidase II
VSSAPKKSSAGRTAEGQSRSLPLNRYVIFFAIALSGCAADLISKQAIFNWLGVAPFFLESDDPAIVSRWRGDPALNHLWWLWDERLGVQTSINTGALFGMGAGRWWMFATLSVVALFGILTWLFIYKAARDRWLTVALACVTGGILGNLYDRLGLWDSTGLKPEFQHGVRDWILFVWPEIKLQIFNPWPNFNIADSLLVTGAVMLVVHAFVWREPKQEAGDRNPLVQT